MADSQQPDREWIGECYWCHRQLFEGDEFAWVRVPASALGVAEDPPHSMLTVMICYDCWARADFKQWFAHLTGHDEDDFFDGAARCFESLADAVADWEARQRGRLGLRDDVPIPWPAEFTAALAAGDDEALERIDWDAWIVVWDEQAGDLKPIRRLIWLPLPCPWLADSKEDIDQIEQTLTTWYRDASQREIDYAIDVFGRAFSGGRIETAPDLEPYLTAVAVYRYDMDEMKCEAVYEWREGNEHVFIVLEGTSRSRLAALLCHCAKIIGDPLTFGNIREGL